jgi:hypothetical protein
MQKSCMFRNHISARHTRTLSLLGFLAKGTRLLGKENNRYVKVLRKEIVWREQLSIV